MPILVDTHAHLADDAFAADRRAVIDRAGAAGVAAIIVMGCDAASSAAAVELAAGHPSVYSAVGIHPNDCAEVAADEWDRVVALCDRPRVVAVGETGLDRHWNRAPFDMQRDYFDRHIRLAQERNLPFVVHTRECDADALAMLREARSRGPLRGVMHSFTGSLETAAECVALGMHISFAGMVTFKKSDTLRAVAVSIPADRILVETDSPYLAPEPFRGKRNEPANVVHTATLLAAARGVGFAEFAAQTTENARRLFNLPLAVA